MVRISLLSGPFSKNLEWPKDTECKKPEGKAVTHTSDTCSLILSAPKCHEHSSFQQDTQPRSHHLPSQTEAGSRWRLAVFLVREK